MGLKNSLIRVSIREMESALLSLDSLLSDGNLKSYEAQEIQSRAHDLSLWVDDIALAVRRRSIQAESQAQQEVLVIIRTERLTARDMTDLTEFYPPRSVC